MTTRRGNDKVLRNHVAPARDWREYLLDSLKDPREAAEYLNAALEDGDAAVFLLALRNVAAARGIGNLASDSKLNREHTYRILSIRGNPQLKSLSALLAALDLKLAIAPKPGNQRRVVNHRPKLSLTKPLEAKKEAGEALTQRRKDAKAQCFLK